MASSSVSHSTNKSSTNERKYKIFRAMFDYSLSTPWYPQTTTKWSPEQHLNRRQLIKYPFPMEWHGGDNTVEYMDDDEQIFRHKTSFMPSSSNHRSLSSHTSRRASTQRQLATSRSSSVPQRRFIIILTNNPDLLRQTLVFQPQTGQQQQQQMQTAIPNRNSSTSHATTNNNNNREQILNTLLQVELRDAARDYLSRTRRTYPIHLVFNMADMDLSQQSDRV